MSGIIYDYYIISIKQYPGAAAVAGDPAREFAALREGTIDLAVGSSLTWATQVKPLNLFALPFMVGDQRALDALLRAEPGAALLHAIEEAGVVPLAWGDNDFREISIAQRPVRRPEELAGLRIRVGVSPLIEDSIRALGAIPVRIKWLEAQQEMLAGTIDGQENSAQTFVATKSHTLGQRYVTLWALASDPLVFAVSRAAWEGWTTGDREIVRQAAVDAASREVELTRRGAAGAEAAIERELRGAGVKVIRLTAEERAAFVTATRVVFEKWANEAGAELVKRAQEVIAASRKP